MIKSKPAKPAKRVGLQPLVTGQVWHMPEAQLQVGMIGKLLVHYKLGKPNALRAVGGACGANPIPVFVPCHRVLAAHDKIGGFSSGLNWKRKLLAREGVKLD